MDLQLKGISAMPAHANGQFYNSLAASSVLLPSIQLHTLNQLSRMMIRSLPCWLALASTAVLAASANYTVSLGERHAAFPETPGAALYTKRCAGPGCAAYPVDLSSSAPFVRFVLKATEADGGRGAQGQPTYADYQQLVSALHLPVLHLADCCFVPGPSRQSNRQEARHR